MPAGSNGLADTVQAANWLSQFDPDDVPFARALLESLVLIPNSVFHRELRELLGSLQLDGDTAALYAIRELDGGAYFANRRSRPRAVAAGIVGSEGIVASIITDVSRETPGSMLNHPPLATVKRKRCHDVVLVDDVSLSGTRASEMIKGFRRNPTFRSWYSLAYVRFHVVAYAMTSTAEDVIRRATRLRNGRPSLHRVNCYYSQRPDAWSPPFTDDVMNAVGNVCVKYAERARIISIAARGFRSGMARIVFERSCPNNAPAILWARTRRWNPLFPDRSVPVSLAPLFTDTEPGEARRRDIEHLLGPHVDPHRVLSDVRDLQVLLLLSALRRKIRDLGRLSDVLGVSTMKVQRAITTAKEHGLVDAHLVLTERGAEELRHAMRAGRLRTEPPPDSGLEYFPKRLRAARSAI